MSSFIVLVLVLALSVFARWDKEQGSYYIAGFAMLIYALAYISTIHWMGLLFVGAGVYTIYKGHNSP